MRRKCCKHFKKKERKKRREKYESQSRLRPGNNNNGNGNGFSQEQVAPQAKPSQARPRLDWSTKTTCRETAARRETLSSRKAICKFDDSFNKNKGKGTEIKHNNVCWQSQGETMRRGEGWKTEDGRCVSNGKAFITLGFLPSIHRKGECSPGWPVNMLPARRTL